MCDAMTFFSRPVVQKNMMSNLARHERLTGRELYRKEGFLFRNDGGDLRALVLDGLVTRDGNYYQLSPRGVAAMLAANS